MIERRPTECVMLEFPRVISVNALFANRAGKGRGRVITRDYAQWREECGLLLNAQRPGRIEGEYALTIRVPAKWRGDLGNAEKCFSDLLQSHGVISNDRLAQRILLEKWPEDHVSVLIAETREVRSHCVMEDSHEA